MAIFLQQDFLCSAHTRLNESLFLLKSNTLQYVSSRIKHIVLISI